MTTILGIDPSLSRTAVAALQPGLITIRDIPTTGTRNDTLTNRAHRLTGITELIDAIWDDVTDTGHTPIDLVVIEGPSLGQRAQVGTFDRAGLWWMLVQQIQPLAPIVEIPPTCRAMYATGKGNAGKDEVMLAAARRYSDVADITNNDQADALVLADCGWHYLTGESISGKPMPQTHLRALTKVVWPAGLAVAS